MEEPYNLGEYYNNFYFGISDTVTSEPVFLDPRMGQITVKQISTRTDEYSKSVSETIDVPLDDVDFEDE